MSTIIGTTDITLNLSYKAMRLADFDVTIPISGEIASDSLLIRDDETLCKVNATAPTAEALTKAIQAGIEAFIPAFETAITKESDNGETDQPQA